MLLAYATGHVLLIHTPKMENEKSLINSVCVYHNSVTPAAGCGMERNTASSILHLNGMWSGSNAARDGNIYTYVWVFNALVHQACRSKKSLSVCGTYPLMYYRIFFWYVSRVCYGSGVWEDKMGGKLYHYPHPLSHLSHFSLIHQPTDPEPTHTKSHSPSPPNPICLPLCFPLHLSLLSSNCINRLDSLPLSLVPVVYPPQMLFPRSSFVQGQWFMMNGVLYNWGFL